MFVERSRLRVGEYLIDQWLPAIKSTVRQSTLNSYRGNIERHVLPSLGLVQVQAVTAPMLTALYQRLADEKALAAKTVRHVHTTLRKAFADAVRWHILERNPSDAADPPKVHRGEMRT